LSVVPNNELISADSLDLITFPIEERTAPATFTIDTWTQHKAFWKSLVLRNLHASLALSYRERPDEPLRTVQPNTERPIKGWGSFFHVEQAGTPDWELDMEAVTLENAKRK